MDYINLVKKRLKNFEIRKKELQTELTQVNKTITKLKHQTMIIEDA